MPAHEALGVLHVDDRAAARTFLRRAAWRASRWGGSGSRRSTRRGRGGPRGGGPGGGHRKRRGPRLLPLSPPLGEGEKKKPQNAGEGGTPGSADHAAVEPPAPA